MSVTCDTLVVFTGFSGFLHQSNWPPRYNWNIVESGIKHHQTNKLYVCIKQSAVFLDDADKVQDESDDDDEDIEPSTEMRFVPEDKTVCM